MSPTPISVADLERVLALAPLLAGRDATRAYGYGLPMTFLTSARYPTHDLDPGRGWTNHLAGGGR